MSGAWILDLVETAGAHLALKLLLLVAHCYNHIGMNNTPQGDGDQGQLYGFEDSGEEDRGLRESLNQIKSRRKAMAGTDTFCRSTHGFAAGRGLWLLQIHNDLQRAGCWQGTDVIPDKNRATN